MRLQVIAVTVAVLAPLAVAAPPAAAARCAVDRSTDFVIFKIRDRQACAMSRMIISDMFVLHPLARWREGTHRYTIPRHGTNYRRGEDYHCYLTVRTRWDAADEHPVATATGSCAYMHRRSTRFYFRSNHPYA